MKLSRVCLSSAKLHTPVKIAVVADLHDTFSEELYNSIIAENPTLVAFPGDIVHGEGKTKEGLRFLAAVSEKFPAFVSVGNHEWRVKNNICHALAQTGARVLDDDFVLFGDLVIGGLSSGYRGKEQGRLRRTPDPETDWLCDLEEAKGFRLLLCHHPEYYPRLLRTRDVDLILSGHAHGGQWRPFGIPIFAPGQGLFPRYTSGMYDGKLLVSRGVANRVRIPRVFNSPELVVVECAVKQDHL